MLLVRGVHVRTLSAVLAVQLNVFNDSHEVCPSTYCIPTTVDLEIFVVKKNSWLPQTTENLHTKFISQPIVCMAAHFHTAAMHLFYVTVMAPLLYLDGVPDGSRGALRLYQYISR